MAARRTWVSWASLTLAAGLQVAGASLAVAPLLLPSAVSAAPRAAVPHISGFDVKGVDRVEAGSELEFTLWGTAGGQASLRIDGAQRPLPLYEASPGVYQGIYTVSRRDKIAPTAAVNANLRSGNRVATALLDEPLQQDYKPPAPPTPPAIEPQISKFELRTENTRDGGATLHFKLLGSPGGRASVNLPGAQTRSLMLEEMQPGQYEGHHVMQAGDRLDNTRPVRARLRLGEHSVTSTADNTLQPVPSRVADVSTCLDCGKVLAVNRIEVNGDGSYVGTAAGGVLGAVVGSQIGQGNGRTAAGVAGAIGGALLGREIERRNTRKVHYEVLVRLNNGSQRSVSYDTQPAWRVGDAVRLVDGTLQAANRS